MRNAKFALYIWKAVFSSQRISDRAFFESLCKNHLVLWELKPVSDGYVFFIRRSSYQMLEALAEKANVDLTLQGQKGLPYFLKEHKKRKILFFSMRLCGLMIFR